MRTVGMGATKDEKSEVELLRECNATLEDKIDALKKENASLKKKLKEVQEKDQQDKGKATPAQ